MSDLSSLLTTRARRRLRQTRWVSDLVPLGADQKSANMRSILLEGAGVGFASAAGPFLPVLLARLGAQDFAIGLLTSLPALAGLLLAIPIGRFLQTRSQIVNWFGASRLIVIAAYAAAGIVPLVVTNGSVELILVIWALITIPNTILNVAFNVVMSEVAGPEGRYYLMSRRWSLLGLMTALTVVITGWALDQIPFPMDYAIVFSVLSLGGIVAYIYSVRVVLPDQIPPPRVESPNLRARLTNWLESLREQPAFVRFTSSQFLFRLGMAMALPLFPLYYVKSMQADDSSIGLINTMNTIVLVGAYFLWARITRRFGVTAALLATTFGLALYPILTALTTSIPLVILISALAGIFGAGLDIVFFDALVASVPRESLVLFNGIYQTTNNIATFIGPLLGTLLSAYIGIPGALLAGGLIRLLGFATLAFVNRTRAANTA